MVNNMKINVHSYSESEPAAETAIGFAYKVLGEAIKEKYKGAAVEIYDFEEVALKVAPWLTIFFPKGKRMIVSNPTSTRYGCFIVTGWLGHKPVYHIL